VRNQKTSKSFCTKVSVEIQKSPSSECRRDKVALRTTCIKNVKFKIKIRTGCQYVGYLYYSGNKLSCTNPLTGPQVGNSWSNQVYDGTATPNFT